jgi:hypothetical protein
MKAQELYDLMADVDPESEISVEVGEWVVGKIPPSLGFVTGATVEDGILTIVSG